MLPSRFSLCLTSFKPLVVLPLAVSLSLQQLAGDVDEFPLTRVSLSNWQWE
jgi:hypothetical protein